MNAVKNIIFNMNSLLIYVHETKQEIFKSLLKYASQLLLITIGVLTIFLEIFDYTLMLFRIG